VVWVWAAQELGWGVPARPMARVLAPLDLALGWV
jgi:hypothetical protein